MPTKLRDGLAIGLFVVLAGYVGFSGIRLGLLLIERFAWADHCKNCTHLFDPNACRPPH